MSFAVDDFNDLIRLLQEHPEWRAELRRLVLTEELLSVPELLRGLTEKVGALAEAQGRTEARLETLAEAQSRTEARLETLAGKVDELVQVVSKLAGEQPGIKGFITEAKYERRAHAYFAPIARRLRVLDPPNLDKLLDAAEGAGTLTEDEADEIRLADIVARGKNRENGSEVLLVVEAAWVVNNNDVNRARDRAKLLARTGAQTIPVVAGEAIESGAEEIAARLGVWRVTNGSVVAPFSES